MSDLTLFLYGSSNVRSVLVDGEPWFVAGDVCAVLGIVNVSDALSRIDPVSIGQTDVPNANGRLRSTNVVDESGLYELIIRSDKPDAVPFRRWITREVLPAIRRTGQFVPAPRLPQSFAAALQLAADQARELETAHALVLEQAPKVEFHDRFVTADGLYKIGDVAKVLALPSMGQNKLFQFLRIQGVLIRSGESRNSPYQRHVEAGRFVIKVTTYPIGEDRTGTSKTTYATPKGLAYIADLVKQYGPSA